MPDGNAPAAARAPLAEASTPALNLHQRLLNVMRTVAYVQKDRTIGTYKVVTHDAVTAAVRPALVANGVVYYPQNLAYVQNGNRTEMSMDIKFVNADNPDDFICVPSLGYGIDAQDKGPGKATSYAVKMALLKALGLETGEDADDGTNVAHEPAKPTDLPVKNAPGITKARQWVSAEVHDMSSCGDGDDLMRHVESHRALWVRMCRTFPTMWNGPDASGLRGEAIKVSLLLGVEQEMRKYIATVEAQAADLQAAG